LSDIPSPYDAKSIDDLMVQYTTMVGGVACNCVTGLLVTKVRLVATGAKADDERATRGKRNNKTFLMVFMMVM
jgi:hypothetical protein